MHYYCLILAGGKGRRLWPVSRKEMPKQFIDFFGTGKSLLQQTYERFCKILSPDHIYVSTYCDYLPILKEQLPELKEENILCEPIRRNTAPIVAWATHRIEKRDPQGTLIITPSDQFIINEDVFVQDILDGLKHASTDKSFLTMGIRPTRPEPGYGYIQLGDSCETDTFYKVSSFTEKPERKFAEMFIKSGEFLWNTGLFISSVETIHQRLETLLPEVIRSIDSNIGKSATTQDEEAWIKEHYSTYPNLSLESGILERTDGVSVKLCNFGWADIGAWHGIYEAFAYNEEDNVVLDTDTSLTDTTGCVIKLSDGRKAIINGLHNYIVAEHGDVLLITPRSDSSNQVVRLLTAYEMNKD